MHTSVLAFSTFLSAASVWGDGEPVCLAAAAAAVASLTRACAFLNRRTGFSIIMSSLQSRFLRA
jgi:hypothetical protein